MRAKNIRFGGTDASTVDNTTLFVDASDGGLKWKDENGTVTVIVAWLFRAHNLYWDTFKNKGKYEN